VTPPPPLHVLTLPATSTKCRHTPFLLFFCVSMSLSFVTCIGCCTLSHVCIM
jgi:hypothetical protein